jgi:hypothetical protein
MDDYAEHIESYVIYREDPLHYEKATISLVEWQGCAKYLAKEEKANGVLTKLNLSRLSTLLGNLNIVSSTVEVSRNKEVRL